MTLHAILVASGSVAAVIAVVQFIDRFANRNIKRVEIEQPGTEPDRRQTIITYDNHTTII